MDLFDTHLVWAWDPRKVNHSKFKKCRNIFQKTYIENARWAKESNNFFKEFIVNFIDARDL